ncbi:MAG: MBL fold metallo-hydrolase [Pseudomonadota bacterium]
MTKMTRRKLLATAAAVPAVSIPGWAAAPMLGPSQARFRRFALGEFEVTTLLAGTAVRDKPQSMFGMNVSEEEFNAVSEAARLPIDKAKFFFTPTIVNTGSDLVLFDTGLSGESITETLSEAGYAPDMVTKVVLTHMHGDHIGGLMTEGAPTFPNANYITATPEFDAWSKMENDRFESNVAPLADKMTFIEDGATGFGGHTAIAAYGHTPGHMIHRIESAGQAIVLIADLANHYVWSLAYPDWEVRFDMDKQAAAQSRRRVLDMLAAEQLPFVGYHMPWPATGFVEKRGDGFAYVPTSYQLSL